MKKEKEESQRKQETWRQKAEVVRGKSKEQVKSVVCLPMWSQGLKEVESMWVLREKDSCPGSCVSCSSVQPCSHPEWGNNIQTHTHVHSEHVHGETQTHTYGSAFWVRAAPLPLQRMTEGNKVTGIKKKKQNAHATKNWPSFYTWFFNLVRHRKKCSCFSMH